MAWGSLYNLLHSGGGGGRGELGGVVVDAGAAVRLACDVAKGMAFLHSLDRDKIVPAYHLNSKHIMVTFIYIYFLCTIFILTVKKYCRSMKILRLV